MRILLTGASSFTGFWFVRALAAGGHALTLVFPRPRDSYAGLRAKRVEMVRACGRAVFDCRFGDDTFLQVIRDGEDGWGMLCHHAAEVTNYKSPDFDVVAAVASNTRNLPRILDALLARGCRKVLLTGSVFEPDEGAGSDGLPAFSPYGLSKRLTAEVFRYHAARAGLRLGKFVIPTPFGPYEERRFTAYLARSWLAGETPIVKTPAYVRDNIHVSLLAKAYARFAEDLGDGSGFERLGPSQYVETQGAFATRFAAAISPRLGVAWS